jgi:FkbM family methyltransferase
MIHSQFDEEPIILEFFKDKNDGIVLDIGAYNPVTFSNSRALINKGWSAVLVEPSPRCFSTIMRFYKDVPNVTLINAFVSDIYGLIQFHDSEGAVATAVQEQFEAWSKVQKDFQSIWVPQIPAAELLTVCPKADFITIDCEGGDLVVIESLPFERLNPSLVCVEYGVESKRISKRMVDLGYKLHHINQANMFFNK